MRKYKTTKIGWMITTMGFGESLLYWDPIVRGFVQNWPNTVIFTCGEKRSTQMPALPVKNAVQMHRLNIRWRKSVHPRQLIFIRAGIIWDVLRYRPKLLVLSEFGLLTIYGIIVAILSPGTRVLLLVESDPRSVAGVKSKFRSLLRRVICWKSDRVLTNNISGEDYLHNDLHVPTSKISVGCYLVSQPAEANFTDHPETVCDAMAPMTKSEGKIVFLFVGRLIIGKGLQYLIEAVSNLPVEYKRRLQIWIAGDGAYRAELKKRIHVAGLEQEIHLLGFIPYTDLHWYYTNADVFVFPTLADYRGLVGFEALAYGLPMLHSELDGAVSEVVANGINGFSFDPYDISTLEQYIKRFLDNAEMRKTFGHQSRQRSKLYTVEKAIDTLVSTVAITLESQSKSEIRK